MQKKKRVNKSKEEIADQIQKTARVERMKVLARLVWPFIQDQKTIYDAQTAVTAAAGFIKQGLELKTEQIIVKDLVFDLSADDASPIKTAVENIVNLMGTEKAADAAALLEKMGSSFTMFGASKYLTNPMSDVSADEFIA